MSIGNYCHVPAGNRDGDNWTKWKAGEDGIVLAPHRVGFCHGGGCLIDELFSFESEEDARWFFDEGYEDMLFEGEEMPDHLCLHIDSQEVEIADDIGPSDKGQRRCA